MLDASPGGRSRAPCAAGLERRRRGRGRSTARCCARSRSAPIRTRGGQHRGIDVGGRSASGSRPGRGSRDVRRLGPGGGRRSRSAPRRLLRDAPPARRVVTVGRGDAVAEGAAVGDRRRERGRRHARAARAPRRPPDRRRGGLPRPARASSLLAARRPRRAAARGAAPPPVSAPALVAAPAARAPVSRPSVRAAGRLLPRSPASACRSRRLRPSSSQASSPRRSSRHGLRRRRVGMAG